MKVSLTASAALPQPAYALWQSMAWDAGRSFGGVKTLLAESTATAATVRTSDRGTNVSCCKRECEGRRGVAPARLNMNGFLRAASATIAPSHLAVGETVILLTLPPHPY